MKITMSFLSSYNHVGPLVCILTLSGMVFGGPVAAQSSMQSTDHGTLHGSPQTQSPSTAPTESKAPPASPPGEKIPEIDPASDARDSAKMPALKNMQDGHAEHVKPATPSEPADARAHGNRKLPDLTPTRQYLRNADGSIPMLGEKEAVLDDQIFAMVLFDELEYAKGREGQSLGWQVQAWIGRDYNKLWIKSEGDRENGRASGNVEAMWSRAFAAFWDWQVGIRHDFGSPPSRQWLALAVQGTAPYWFDIAASAYIGPNGRTAARFKSDYTFRLSQTTFLSPEIEVNAYGKAEPERGIGSGLSDVSFGLRLRHEIRREIQPYIGVTWGRKLGNTAHMTRDAGEDVIERNVVAGVRFWF